MINERIETDDIMENEYVEVNDVLAEYFNNELAEKQIRSEVISMTPSEISALKETDPTVYDAIIEKLKEIAP